MPQKAKKENIKQSAVLGGQNRGQRSDWLKTIKTQHLLILKMVTTIICRTSSLKSLKQLMGILEQEHLFFLCIIKTHKMYLLLVGGIERRALVIGHLGIFSEYCRCRTIMSEDMRGKGRGRTAPRRTDFLIPSPTCTETAWKSAISACHKECCLSMDRVWIIAG